MKSRLYAPGPVELPPQVLAALSQPVQHHRTAGFAELQERVSGRLADVFLVPGDEVITLSSSGSGAMEAAFLACVPQGSKVLAINAGKFGERWVNLAQAHGAQVVELKAGWGRAADPDQLAQLLEDHPDVTAVLATHSETSTGVLHDIQALASAARRVNPDILFLVDAVTSLASAELRPREWQLDAVVSGSQKGLLTPPGLGFVWLSERAWAQDPALLAPSFYLNLRSYRGGRQPMTPATSLIAALDVALGLLLAEGLEQVWARRQRLTGLLIEETATLGFSVFAERVTPAVAALKVPEGVSARQLVSDLASLGVTIAGGQDHVADLIVRPSLLGHADELDVAVIAAAFRKALKLQRPVSQPDAGR